MAEGDRADAGGMPAGIGRYRHGGGEVDDEVQAAVSDVVLRDSRSTVSRAMVLAAAVVTLSAPCAALSIERPESTATVRRELIEWTAGDLPGGDVRSLAIHPENPDLLLAGTASGQVFRSVDGGDSWNVAGVAVAFPGWVVSDILFDSENPSQVWAALRGMLGQEGFVAVSADGGATWQDRSRGLPRRQIYALAATPSALFAATRVGVWGSRDGGATWQHLTAAHPEIQKVTSLLVDPGNPERVFAGTWRRAYRSDDGGSTWRGIFEGMILDSEVFSLHAAPGEAGEIWASTCGWVYRSLQSGGSWSRFSNGLEERRTPSFQALPDGGRLAGTVAGVYRSDNDGGSWQRVTPDTLVALAIEHHPRRPDRVFIASEGAGVWRSLDGGRTFQPASRGLNAVRIASLAAVDGEVLAAVRHAGPASGIYSSFDGGRSYPLGPARLPTVVELASDGRNVYAATEEGLWERSEDSWRRIDLLGNGPVRQIASAGERIVARSDDGVFLRQTREEDFVKILFDRGDVASVAIDRNAVWISSVSDGLFRFSAGELVASATPIKSGRLQAVAGRLLIAEAGELWARSGLGTAWQELGRSLRFLPTSSDRHPVLLVAADGEARLVADQDGDDRLLDLRIPTRDLSAALVSDERVVVGTSGFGLFVAELEESAAAGLPAPVESAR